MHNEEGTKVIFNLFALKRRLELHTGQAYTWKAIAKGAGLHENTLLGMANNDAVMVRLETLGKLTDFFDSQGMPVELSDLLVVTRKTAA